MNGRIGDRTRPANTTLDSASTGIGRQTTIAQLPWRSMIWFARAMPSDPTSRRAAPSAFAPKAYPIAQPIVIPSQMIAAPFQKPNSTPAPVETMLEGTGRKTSSARRPPIVAAETQPDACPSVSQVPSASNCFSKIRNGMMISANINPIRTAHRIATSRALGPRGQHGVLVLLDLAQPGSPIWKARAGAVVVPHRAPGKRFEFLLCRQAIGVVRGGLLLAQDCRWLDQRLEKSLQHVPRADDPRGDAVDAG